MDVEDEFLSCAKDYCGPDPDQTRQIIEPHPDSSSDEDEESSEHKQGSGTHQLASEPAESSDRKVDSFIRKSCGCQLGLKCNPCSGLFTKEEILDQRLDCLALEKSELDMVILGQLQAFSKDTETEQERIKTRIVTMALAL